MIPLYCLNSCFTSHEPQEKPLHHDTIIYKFIDCTIKWSTKSITVLPYCTCNNSPTTGLNVCPSGRGAFGSGLVAARR